MKGNYAEVVRGGFVRQPKVGDSLMNGRYGAVTVLAVHNHGRILDVSTQVHGPQRIERADRGWWVRHVG